MRMAIGGLLGMALVMVASVAAAQAALTPKDLINRGFTLVSVTTQGQVLLFFQKGSQAYVCEPYFREGGGGIVRIAEAVKEGRCSPLHE